MRSGEGSRPCRRRAVSRLACIALPLVAAAAAPVFGQAQEATPSWQPPPRIYGEWSPSQKLEVGVHNLFELLAEPNPKYEPFVRFSYQTRVVFVVTRPGGLAQVRMFEGEAARRFLEKFFGPDSGLSYTFGSPEVALDGAFGRARLAFVTREEAKPPQCGFAYIDAALTPPGKWARFSNQGHWRFTQITVSFESSSLEPCPRS